MTARSLACSMADTESRQSDELCERGAKAESHLVAIGMHMTARSSVDQSD